MKSYCCLDREGNTLIVLVLPPTMRTILEGWARRWAIGSMHHALRALILGCDDVRPVPGDVN